MVEQDDGFWCPNPIQTIRKFLYGGIEEDNVLAHRQAFVSNIAYHLQYLEFLNRQLLETKLHTVIKTQIQKTFVVTGMSIIEAILWYVLRKNGIQPSTEWGELRKLSDLRFEDGESKFLVRATILKKQDKPIDVEIKLHSMIKQIESKTMLGEDHQVYRNLNYLKKLRNRVHIHAVQHDRDTDWYSFSEQEVKLMKAVLLSVLTGYPFKPEPTDESILSYLRVDEPIDQFVNQLS